MDPAQTNRLDRIESKLDKVVDTLTVLARVEERQQASNKRMDRFEFRLDELETDLDDCRTSIKTQGQSLKLSERVYWVMFATVLSTAAGWFARKLG